MKDIKMNKLLFTNDVAVANCVLNEINPRNRHLIIVEEVEGNPLNYLINGICSFAIGEACQEKESAETINVLSTHSIKSKCNVYIKSN